jgi:decaprenyl-phosphate phosphoribosyltransferase
MRLKERKLSHFISIMRVQHWIKNLFVLLPMFFNRQFLSFDSLMQASIAFISFSLVASSNYCFNDIVDLEFDKKHNFKKKRALASGLISIREAKLCLLICAAFGFVLSYFLSGFNLFIILITYFIINVFYTLIFKNIMILDVVLITIGFILRLLAGAKATNTELSHWIIIMVLLLALFLAFAKRRDEVVIYQETNVKVRKNINNYSLKFLDSILLILSILIIVFYTAYSFSPEITTQFNSNYVWITSIFVLLGVLRYNRLIKMRADFVNPTKIILTDIFMQLIVVSWLICFYIIIYG